MTRSFALAVALVSSLAIAQEFSLNGPAAPDARPEAFTEAVQAASELTVNVIGSEATYQVGDLIELKAEVLGLGDASVVYDWEVLPPKGFRKWPDQSRLLFGTGPVPTDYTVVLAVGTAKGSGSDITQEIQTRIVNVRVTQGSATPTPDGPQAPDGPQLGRLGALAARAAQQIATSDNYSNEDLKTDAALLAANFKATADKLASGELDTLRGALEATRKFNQSFANKEIWTDWFSKISVELSQANKEDNLDTNEKVIAAWRDIANGLLSL